MGNEFQHTFNDDKKNVNQEILNVHSNRDSIILILDGLTDIGNVGSIFRIADALRIKKIYIYNYDKKFNEKLLKRKSRSTIKYVPFEYTNEFNQILQLKNEYKFYVLDKTNKSIEYNSLSYNKKLCLVIGSENYGVSQKLIDISDQSIHLPMYGINTSVNVATATSVALYHIFNDIKR